MNILRQGTIFSGDYIDWKITIDDDRKGRTGGYYIYIEDNGIQGTDPYGNIITAFPGKLK